MAKFLNKHNLTKTDLTSGKKLGLPRWHGGKECACQSRRHKWRGFSHWVGKIPWRRKWQPTPVFLPGEFHGQRCLVVYSLWDCKESDMTKHTHNTHTHSNFLLFSLSNLESTTHQQVSLTWSLKLSWISPFLPCPLLVLTCLGLNFSPG